MTFSPTDAAGLVREAREDQRIEYHLPDDTWTADYRVAKAAWPPLEPFRYRVVPERPDPAAIADQLEAACAEVERLTKERDQWSRAVGELARTEGRAEDAMHNRWRAAQIERDRAQSDLAKARAEGERLLVKLESSLDTSERIDAERQQAQSDLAAALKAKDELADIAERLAGLECDSAAEDRITELRSVGKEKP
jgi:phage-related minor tail protein